MKSNMLYYGDNLDIIRRYIEDDSIDLIYLDPPFNSKATYNVLFKERSGGGSRAQIIAFDDFWSWNEETARAYIEVVESGGQVSRALQAFRKLLGDNDMLAYLTEMSQRLLELHRVLKPIGSIYLHCDPTASHYLKVLMDAIFSPKNFRNEIIWGYRRYTAIANRYQRMHDVILFYGKSDTINYNDVRLPYGKKSGKRDSHYKQDEDGRWFRWQKRKGKEPYKIYLSEGVRVGDWWDIPLINASAKERLGYPTQKPEELLERIIEVSSNPGDIVLDPFCGCGTTVAVANRFDRKWIGIDITHLAITLIKHRLSNAFGEDVFFETVGEPVSLPDARKLAKQDRFQFQLWALGLVNARPDQAKKGADKGIDGVLYFHDNPNENTKQIIISVKSGKPGVGDIRDLHSVIERENAQIGVLITLHEPTKPMKSESASYGFYDSPWGKHPKMQIFTIQELLDGKVIDRPPTQRGDTTFEKAPKTKQKGETFPMFDDELN